MMDSYVYALVALLPLAAGMVVMQTNPYQALVIRGILGAVAALVYAVLGGADVALTEALVGTMLAITLYAVAVRSSLVMKLGVLEETSSEEAAQLEDLWKDLRAVLGQHHLRLELVPYADVTTLKQALQTKDVHGICMVPLFSEESLPASSSHVTPMPPLITLRVQRLYDLITADWYPNLAEIQSISGDHPVLAMASTLGEES